MENKRRFASVAVITRTFDGQKEVLLLKRKRAPKGYGLPGGKQDPGESPTETMLREVHEETNLLGNNQSMLYFLQGKYKSQSGRNLFVFNLSLKNFSDLKVSSEHKYYAWIPVKHLGNVKLAGNTKQFLAHLKFT